MMKLFVTTFLAAVVFTTPVRAQDHQHEMHIASGETTTLHEGGQGAFAAIGEIVANLEADPKTDWSRVNIDALRQHLVDMDNVMLHARVTNTPIAGGVRFNITGDTEDVKRSIRNMVRAHAVAADGENGNQIAVVEAPDGMTMTVIGPKAQAQAKIRALGFFGLMTVGAHHQKHHLMMATGQGHR